jgi:Na+/melibiose symporter-like transporter
MNTKKDAPTVDVDCVDGSTQDVLIDTEAEKGSKQQSFVLPDNFKRDKIEGPVLLGYSVGHFANDLCASMWFIYLSYYLLYVVGLSENVSGLCLLSGQITDGITTPIVGILSDKVETRCGKRNIWYYFGTILVVPSFLCIWVGFDFFSSMNGKDAWYIIFPAIFNVGWASVQIAHLAIVPQLSYSQRKRDNMVNYRNSLTYAANIFVLGFSTILFLWIKDPVN